MNKNNIIIETDSEGYDLLKDFISELGESSVVLTTHKFQGDSETTMIIIELSKVLIPSISAIIIKLIDSKKSISVKHNGIKFNGISEKNIVQMLNDIIDGNE